MPLTRNEKIAVGVGVVGAIGLAALAFLRPVQAARGTARLTYTGNGGTANVIRLPFQPKRLVFMTQLFQWSTIMDYDFEEDYGYYYQRGPVEYGNLGNLFTGMIAAGYLTSGSIDVAQLPFPNGNVAGTDYVVVAYA